MNTILSNRKLVMTIIIVITLTEQQFPLRVYIEDRGRIVQNNLNFIYSSISINMNLM
jgi:hypothetical protein